MYKAMLSLLMILIGVGMFASCVLAQQAKASIPASEFFKMFADKDEAALRKDAMWRMTEITIRYPGTSFADEARRVVNADAGREDAHAWIADTLKVVGDALRAYPPTEANWHIRREAFLLLDYPLHVETGDQYHRALASFYRPFIDKAFKEIQSARVTKGVRIWHIYNMGFVVKSARHTIAFDIFTRNASPGYEWMTFLTERQTKELAKIVDMAFVSHWHGDHANTELLAAMSEAGKKVVVPLDESYQSEVLKMSGIVPVRAVPADAPLDVGGLRVYSYPGFQADVPCNVYVVDVDGCVISQNGDNCAHSLYADIAKHHQIDIALANCWSGTNEFVEGVAPKFFVTGHENELQHDVIHRVPYKNTYGNLDTLGIAPPWKLGQQSAVILSCGEGVSWPTGKALLPQSSAR